MTKDLKTSTAMTPPLCRMELETPPHLRPFLALNRQEWETLMAIGTVAMMVKARTAMSSPTPAYLMSLNI